MSETGTCKDCGARLLWVTTQNSRRMPLDHDPERRFVLEAGKDPMIGRLRNTYTCHIDTCKKRKV